MPTTVTTAAEGSGPSTVPPSRAAPPPPPVNGEEGVPGTDRSGGTHLTPHLPPRVGNPDLAGQGGPRPEEDRGGRGDPAARDPAAARPRAGRGHRKAPRHPVR
ncbi:hypothetical protein [Streptomyces sp. NPDC020983]|uniref:hypothetical protein n=1 Tax=Streptomyces sp. NPDC020983 TaxID=3365106 RepID=UPI00379E17AD